MAFNFGGASSSASLPGTGFGAATTTSAPTGFGFGSGGTGFGSLAPSGGPTAPVSFGGFGLGPVAPVLSFGSSLSGAGAFGGFGSTTTSAGGTSFSFSTPSNTGASLFGNTQSKGFGFSSGLGSSGGLGGAGLGFGGFGGIQTAQNQPGGLFNQQVSQSSQLFNTASALSAPSVLSDERDSILARWNQLQAFWGVGKGYYSSSTPPVEFSQENPFCRFKAVGYSCVPDVKDEDGLVVLALNKKEADVRSQQQQLVELMHKVLGGNPTLSVNVEGVRALPDDQAEMIIYLVERSPSGTSKRVPASTLYSYMEQMNVKSALQQLGVIMAVSRTALTPAQLKQLLQNPPAGVDPIIWEQAKVDNPDPEKLIPVPMVGFKELLRRLKIQDQMTKQHQTRVDIISNDISELQRNQATTAAKITQYKRKLMDLSHRVLQVPLSHTHTLSRTHAHTHSLTHAHQ
ncbi:nuclear pore complex protein Nup54-like [Sinocyclocheilus anshuiensis]|uniref:nuclear pore complex protein Nup54-like n=1 Tax=Sinocyclocheilus anshuiensis TaxID=1608454 RepID=UPI0007B8255A|nr:PREDICTED: nuclear pore complex protein Nup54-like [Sinocyclocheilus anshuiensis]